MKKKKCLFCWIALALILAFFIFKEVKDTLQGEKLFFLTSWQYRNSKYAKYLEIKPYVLNQEQLAYMINHPDEEITQPNEKELSHKDIYIVFRMKNHGDLLAFGRLSYKFEHFVWMKTNVTIPSLTPKHNHYFDLIIPIGIGVVFGKDVPPTAVEYKWDVLHTAP